VSLSLQEMLVDAQRQGRLTCGIYDSGTLLAKYVHGRGITLTQIGVMSDSIF